MRKHPRTFSLIGVAFLTSGCNQQTHSGCQTLIALTPYVQLIYPEANATNVDPQTGFLVYSAQSSVPVSIQTGSSAPIGLSTTPLPSPLPSPAASPINTDSADIALTLPTLQAASTYSVTARVSEVGCGIDQPTNIGIGSFTTR